MQIIDFIVNQILRETSIFLGIVVLIGMIVLKKSTQEVTSSTIKTIVGVRIFQSGVDILVNAATPMLDMIVEKFGLESRIGDLWLGVGEGLERISGTSLASQIGLIMILAWLLHLLFSRFTKLKVVYLSGHLMFADTVLITFFIYTITGWVGLKAILLAIVLLAINWWLWPALMIKPLKKLIGDDNMTIGHQTAFFGFVAMWIAKITGDLSKDTEALKFPGWLNILKDQNIAFTFVMALLYLLIGIFVGPEVGKLFSGEMNPTLYSFIQGINVAAGIIVIIFGVKIFQDELIPAFEGFAKAIVPGAIPALDTVMFWPYAPQATILGFIFTLLGMITGIILQILLGSKFLTIPGIISIFSGGFTMGVFAAKYGGVRGTIIATYVLGIVQIFGSAWLAQVIGMKIAGGGHMDYCTYWPAVFLIIKKVVGVFN